MRSQRRRAPAIALAAFIGFVGGVIVMAVFEAREARTIAAGHPSDDCGRPDATAPTGLVQPASPHEPVAVTPEPQARSAVPGLGIDPIADLRKRDLRLPVRGVEEEDLVRSFSDKRGANRVHEAIDILAPRHTPVLAVDDGVLVKFFHSQAGGITIYQFDPASRYAYYYAHLERYAAGVKEGDRVKKGQIIGHVGTTGNAPPNTPHLHFAIFRLTEQKQWWKGTPIDPFDVWQ